jgi:hypothetical protein
VLWEFKAAERHSLRKTFVLSFEVCRRKIRSAQNSKLNKVYSVTTDIRI